MNKFKRKSKGAGAPLKPGMVDQRTVKEVVIGTSTTAKLDGQVDIVPRTEPKASPGALQAQVSRNAAWLEEANEVMESIDAYEISKAASSPARRGKVKSQHNNMAFDDKDERYESWTAGERTPWGTHAASDAGTPAARTPTRARGARSEGAYCESESSVGDGEDGVSRRSASTVMNTGDHIPTILEEPVPGDDGAELANALSHNPRTPKRSPLGLSSGAAHAGPDAAPFKASPFASSPGRSVPSVPVDRVVNAKPEVEAWVTALLSKLSHRKYREAMMMPAPRGGRLHCYIKRRKDALAGDTYAMHLEGSNLFLMAARRRKKSVNSQYLLSAEGGKVTRRSPGSLAVLRANYSGTQYTAHSSETVNEEGRHTNPAELVAIRYKQTTLTMSGGPRALTVVVPDPELHCRWAPSDDHETLHSCYEKRKKNDLPPQIAEKISVLKSNPPVWDEALKSYTLDFGGRVHDSSVKNCQLTTYDMDTKDRSQHLVFLFGRASDDDSDRFVVDFCYPLCPLQALSCALSVLDSKLCYAM